MMPDFTVFGSNPDDPSHYYCAECIIDAGFLGQLVYFQQFSL